MKFKDSEKIYKDEFIMNSRPYLRESLWYEFNLNSFANSLTYIHSVNKNRCPNYTQCKPEKVMRNVVVGFK